MFDLFKRFVVAVEKIAACMSETQDNSRRYMELSQKAAEQGQDKIMQMLAGYVKTSIGDKQ